MDVEENLRHISIDIKYKEEEIKSIVSRLEEEENPESIQHLRKREEHLRTEKEQLRTEKEQLNARWNLLLQKSIQEHSHSPPRKRQRLQSPLVKDLSKSK